MDAIEKAMPYVRVFGGMGIDDGDEPVSIGGLRQRRLLALLAIRTGSVVGVDWLAEHLWSDDERPEAAAPAIRTYMSRLRQRFPEVARDWLETESGAYRFTAPPDRVEHLQFSLLRQKALRARESEDPQTAQAFLDEALAMWRGDPFRELEDLDWAVPEIEQLRLERLETLEERWEVALAQGRHTQITGELATFTAEHGLRDRAARQYALALHRSGRTNEGLRVIDDHRRQLAGESGLEPTAAVIELERALFAGDPSLDVETKGRPLRGYRLVEEIGSGAFALVWRAEQPSVNRQVAIKQIRSELAARPEFIRRFEAEAHLVARIEHPHIVPLIDFWRDPDSAYLVMRWLRGGTLERRLDDGPLSVEETCTLAQQMCGALAAAHKHGIVHRDVKSGNILFDESGNAFLGDFGIALEAKASTGPDAALSTGSPAYSAPEQIRRERLGPEADIFSLGVVLFECLTGSLPFHDTRSAPELIEKQLNDDYPPLIELRSDVPSSVSDAVAKATAKNPVDRFSSMAAFLEALETAETSKSQTQDTRSSRPVFDGLVANPYKGLRAFDAGDSSEFFGRESLIAQLVDRLSGATIKSRCVVVVGPSGSGKSSVVRAGLLPALRSGAVPGSENWFTTTMVPGTDPFESLEAALLRVAVNPPDSLLAQLHDERRGILRGLRRCLPTDADRTVVVIDQFEEIFTNSSHETANAFLEGLAVAVEDPSSPLRLVITLRADYFDRPLSHPTFARILDDASVNVKPLAPEELERAMLEPARRIGVEFEPGLVARIAADTVGRSSSLPLLQYTLAELFDRRVGAEMTIESYDELGGVTGALAARAEAIYTDANEANRVVIRRAFGRMVNPGEELADLRRRVPIADLGTGDAIRAMLDEFGAARLITFDRDPTTREPTVEVAHEALLREWPRLVEWLAEDADLLRSTDVVATAANSWDESGRRDGDLYRGGRLENAIGLNIAAPDRLRVVDSEFIDASRVATEAQRSAEKGRVRRLRRLVAGTGVALVLALLAGGLALVQQQRANDEAERAQVAATEAETQAGLALEAAETAELATLISRSVAQTIEDQELALLLALEAHRRSPDSETEQVVMNALGASTLATRVSRLAPFHDDAECAALSTDSIYEFGMNGGRLLSRDMVTDEIVDFGPPPAECVNWYADIQNNVRFAGSFDGDKMWLGPLDGPWTTEIGFEEPTYATWFESIASGWVSAVSFPGEHPTFHLLDTETGSPIREPIVREESGAQLLLVEGSQDGTLLAVGFGTPGRAGGDGETLVLDTATGEILFNVESPLPAGSAVFDMATNELVVARFDGVLMTIDLESGVVVAEVSTGTASDFTELGIAPDGLVVAVTFGEIKWLDRRTGPTGRTTELRDTGFAVYRPDGLLMTANIAGDESGVVDLEGSALIDRSWEVDSFSTVAFNDGLAVAYVCCARDSGVVVIDLAAGERRIERLLNSDGSQFVAQKHYPETDGLVAVSLDGVVVRTVDDDVVERVDLSSGTHQTGTRYEDLWALILGDEMETRRAVLVNVARGELEMMFSVEAPNAMDVHPTPEGGVYVTLQDGTIRSYDAAGTLVSEHPTDVREVGGSTLDPTTGTLAMAGAGKIWIVDPVSGTSVQLPGDDRVANLAFARNGELLAVTSADGIVRLWDVEREASAGVVWNGSGAVGSSPGWYNEETESLWVYSSNKLLEVPLNPDQWISAACEVVARDMSLQEWDQFVPGDESLQSACP